VHRWHVDDANILYDTLAIRWEQQVKAKVFELGNTWSSNEELRQLMLNDGMHCN
jgi:hypothetical protein